MSKSKRADKSKERQEWEHARDRAKVEAEDEMFHRDFKAKKKYAIPQEIIVYIDSPAKANQHLAELMEALKKENQEFNYFGFDVEGTSDPKSRSKEKIFETLQLHTEIGDRKYNYVFQLNRFGKNNTLPRELESLLKLRNNVYIGKGVEDKVRSLLCKYGIPAEL